MNDQAPLPPKIAAAIVAIMGAVPKLERTEKNTHGKYNFASIDDFLEAVRPLCATHGLIIIQDENSFEIVEGAQTDSDGRERRVRWLIMRYSYTLAHSSGETWEHRPTRTITVNAAMGSQAFGAAQSYAMKQFMRSLLQIATGERDEDADTHKPESLPARRSAAKRGGTESSGGHRPDAASGHGPSAAGGPSRADEARRRFMIKLDRATNITAAAELDAALPKAQAVLGPHYAECAAALQARVAELVRGRGKRPVEIPGETYEPPPAEDAPTFGDEVAALEPDEWTNELQQELLDNEPKENEK